MSTCNDSIESKNTSSLISTDGFAYSPTIQIYQLDKITLEFQKNSVITLGVDPFIQDYGQDVFNQSLISFNNFLLVANSNTFLNLSVNYPLVQDRINRGVAITPVEFSDFMSFSGYNPVSIVLQQTKNPKIVLDLYNSHINGKFSKSTMGTFCELAPSIFGAVSGFFTAIGSLANKITDIINGIQNFSLASLLSNLKEKIMSVIESAINRIKKIVENFSMQGIISQAKEFFHTQIMYRFKELKDQALAFFEENNIENFKKRIEGLISYATGIFKDPSIEEIQFLIYRFCSFITQVEDIINLVKAPLSNFSNRYISAGRILESRSNFNTVSAVSAGAKRFNNDEIYSTVTAGVASETSAGNPPPPLTGEIEGVTSWNGGAGDSRVTFIEGSLATGPESWNRVTVDVKVKLMRLQQKFGKQIRIVSAWRSAEKQAALYAKDLKENGGVPSGNVAKNSLHEVGEALDIKFDGLNSDTGIQFIDLSRAEGFGGAKNYSNRFIHIDVGAVRTW
jgi:hypothetical protein